MATKTLPTEYIRFSGDGQHHDFGIVDQRGRAQGALVWTGPCTMEASDGDWGYDLPVGPAYAYQANGTRNGKRYGPVTGSRGIFATAAERDAAVEHYLKQARKSAAKRAAKAAS